MLNHNAGGWKKIRMTYHDQYQSPLSWRYAGPEMRGIWGEHHKRLLWRRIWVALAEAQASYGLVDRSQVEELRGQMENVDIPRAFEIESEIHHDLMAELKTFAEQCPSAGGILHLGATSMDIEDNADVLRLRESLDLIQGQLNELLLVLADLIERTAGQPIMAFTHIQPAEPTTLGYRLAVYAQDLLEDFQRLKNVRASIRGKGFKGAVGTGAAYMDLIGAENFTPFEEQLSNALGLEFYEVSTQTYPRKQEYEVVCALAGLGASLSKQAFDLRLLQTPPIGELSEPFGTRQVGSSAMPFKRNPINSEKVNSLARVLMALQQTAWQNAANALLERTLDDSANRRMMLPQAFLISDELLRTMLKVMKGLNIHNEAIQRNLDAYAPFAATERVMMAAARKGADRQEMHERLRGHALAAWEAVQSGKANPLAGMMKADAEIKRFLDAVEIDGLMDVSSYTGIASARAREMATRIHAEVAEE